MRKLVAGFAISLDGFIAGPNGEFDWIPINKEIDFAEMMKRYDTYLIGRKTYDLVKKSGQSFGKSDKIYVFSKTLKKIPAPSLLINRDVSKNVKAIKKQTGKDIALFGGGELLTSFLDLNLVDEISMAVIPIILGEGIPLARKLKKRVTL